MKLCYYLAFASLLFMSESVNAQGPPRKSFEISTVDDSPEPEDSLVETKIVIEGDRYDTAVFDTTHKVPFKIYENRGEEMTHSWIHLGAPHAPHIYVGAGIYRFDKSGLSDVQIGWYPSYFAKGWETYFSAQRMFFLKKKTKNVNVGIRIDEDYYNRKVVKYVYNAPLRRDKFYGVVAGIGCEGYLNLLNRTSFYQYQQLGEINWYQVNKYSSVNVKVGLARMRCKNVEYEAPFRRQGRFRASSFSRLQIGMLYFPIQRIDVTVIRGTYADSYIPFSHEPFAFYFSWEGRVAVMHMKREWGFSANFMFVTPSWNRVREDLPIAINQTWGIYFSLDKRNPRWRQHLTT